MYLKIIFRTLRISFIPFLIVSTVSCSIVSPILIKKQYTINDVTQAVSAENYALAGKEIKYIDTSGMTPETLRRFDFIKGVIGYKTGNYKDAQAHFRKLLSQNMSIHDYINWYMAESYEGSGDCGNALLYLKNIAAHYTESIFYKPSIQLMGQCMSELKLYNDAISLYGEYITNPSFYNQLPEMLTSMAALYISTGDKQNGISNYVRVYTQFPGSPSAAFAFSALGTLTDTSTLNIDHYQTARLLMMDGRYSSALGELNAAVHEALSEKDNDKLSEIYKSIGIIYYNTGMYADAIPVLKLSLHYNQDKHSYTEAMFWLGKAFLKTGDRDSAISTFMQVAYTKSSYASMAMYKLYSLYNDNSDKKNVEYWLLKLAATGTPFSLDAYWHLGWLFYSENDFRRAVHYFGKMQHSRYSDQYGKIKAKYWYARTLLKRGETEKASSIFFDIANTLPVNYYTIMSNMWAGENTLTYEANSIDMRIQSGRGKLFNYHYSRYRFLESLGMTKEAWNELDLLAHQKLSADEYLLLCQAYYSNGDYYRSLYIARTELGDMLQTFTQGTMPVWFYSYPAGYSRIIEAYSSRYNLDPALIYAIILQESRYKADAVSDAGAIGIMQLMPYTASMVAKNISITPFSSQVLFDPQINIGIGIWHFRQLMTKYRDNYVLALAAYNAGGKAVDKWLAGSTTCNTDEFIEDIPFSETRHYIKSIIADLAAYTMIYGGKISLEKHIYMEGRFLKSCLPKH